MADNEQGNGSSNSTGACSIAPASSAAVVQGADQPVIQQETLEAQRLKEILVALDILNINMSKMEKSLAEMLNGGVKVKWLK
jgi:hypothetical protein